ncbi:MAG: hypothetical protein ABIJ81_03905 [Patescibacteria group bacterium]
MTLKQYLLLMFLGTLGAWAAWLTVIFYLTPESSGTLGLIFFYLSLFVAVVGTTTLIGFTFRYWLHKDEVVFRQVSISFRQGVLLGIVVILALILQAQRLLTWWNLGILLLALTIVEFFFLSMRRTPHESE